MHWNRPFGAGLIVVAFAACGAASETTHPEDPGQGTVVGRTVPDLQLTALNGGKDFRLSDLRGKVFLLDVWASWCAPCKEELPMLDDMVARLQPKGIEIVAVSIDDNREDAELFLRQSRPSWSIKFAHDPNGTVPGKLQPPKMPSSYVIDREGVIRQVNGGFVRSDAEKMEARLVELVDTSPSERTASSSPSAEAPAAVDSTSNSASHPTAAAAESSEAMATRMPSHPVPTASGSIDGRPFTPKLARVVGRMQKDGRIRLSVGERTDCAPSNDSSPGDATLTITVPWKDGYKADIAPPKRTAKKSPVGITFSRVNGSKKNEVSKTFKPMGSVTIVSAPMALNAVGKMKLDLSSGDYALSGDLDIQVCVPPK